MKPSSARGRGTASRPRRRAQVIKLPTPRRLKRRRAFRAAVGFVVTALIAAISMRVYLTRNAQHSPEEMAGLSEPETDLLKQVNSERARRGLKLLKLSARLAVVARGHSYDMAIRRYHENNSPGGGTPAQRIRGMGIDCVAVAENIYVDNYRRIEGLADRTIKGWINNVEHSQTLFSPDFTQTGIGIARSSDGLTYVTEDFVR